MWARRAPRARYASRRSRSCLGEAFDDHDQAAALAVRRRYGRSCSGLVLACGRGERRELGTHRVDLGRVSGRHSMTMIKRRLLPFVVVMGVLAAAWFSHVGAASAASSVRIASI